MILGESVKFFDNTKTYGTENNFKKVSVRGQNNSQFTRNNSGNIKIYTYCGKLRHTVETYYKKHGFPLDINSRILVHLQIKFLSKEK